MKAFLRNLLVAAPVATVVGFGFGVPGDKVNAPNIGATDRVLAASMGILTIVFLHLRRANHCSVPEDAHAQARAPAFVCPRDHALVYFVSAGSRGATRSVDIDADVREAAQIDSPRFTGPTLTPQAQSFKDRLGGRRSSMAPESELLSVAEGSVTPTHDGIRRRLLKSNLAVVPWALDMAKARLGMLTVVLPGSAATGSHA